MTNSVGQYPATFRSGTTKSLSVAELSAIHGARDLAPPQRSIAGQWQLMVGAVETLTVTAERLVQPTSAVRTLIQPVAVRELPLLTARRSTRHAGARSLERSPGGGLLLRPGQPRHHDQRGAPERCQLAAGWRLQCQRLEQFHAGDHAFPGSNPGDHGDHEHLPGRMGPQRRWARQRVTKAGTNGSLGALTISPQRCAERQLFLSQHGASGGMNSAPRRHRYNNFGFTLGGPALPARKNMFFFFSETGGEALVPQ